MSAQLYRVLVTHVETISRQTTIAVLAHDADDARRLAYQDADTLTPEEWGRTACTVGTDTYVLEQRP
jgi:hypothetical protein